MRLPAATVSSDLSFLPFSSVGLVPRVSTHSRTPRLLAGWARGDSDQPQTSGGGGLRSQEGEAGTSQGSKETLERTPGCPPPHEWGRSAEGPSEMMTSREGVHGDRGIHSYASL